MSLSWVALLFFGVAVAAELHQIPLTFTPSLRNRMFQEGRMLSYLKQKAERTAAIRSNAAQAGTNLIDTDDMAYSALITLGSPGQVFIAFLDTSSANLWVTDASCAQGQGSQCGTYCKTVPYSSCVVFCADSCCTGNEPIAATTNACLTKHMFNQSLSTTYQKHTGNFDITYQTGEVKGFYGTDVFCLNGTTLCATSQTFGQATYIGGDFAKQPLDGILGLGWQSLAYDNIVPPMFNLLNQGKLTSPVFTVYMAGVGPTSSLNGGQLTVGGYDTTNCGPVANVALTSQTFWQFKMSGVSVGSYSNTPAVSWQAMSDTASTLIGGPTAVVNALAKAVGAEYVKAFDSYFIDCDAETNDIVFTINGQQYNVRAKNYVVSVGPGPCLFAFFPQDAGGFYPSWMLGPPLIREFCQVYDMQNKQLGFAKVLKQ